MLSVTICAALVVPVFWLVKVSEVGETDAVATAPVPLSVTLWVVPVLLLSVNTSVPVRAPFAVGRKVTPTVQVAFTGRKAPQVREVMKKSPVATMERMVSVEVPVLRSVTICEVAGTPTACVPKVRLVGETSAFGPVAPAPVPVRVTAGTVTVLLEEMVMDPVAAPVAVGANVTETVQVEPAASDVPHVLAEIANGAPDEAMLLMVRGPLPVLDSVNDFAALVVPVF